MPVAQELQPRYHRHRSAPRPLPPGGVVVTRSPSRLITPWPACEELT